MLEMACQNVEYPPAWRISTRGGTVTAGGGGDIILGALGVAIALAVVVGKRIRLRMARAVKRRWLRGCAAAMAGESVVAVVLLRC